MREEPEVVARFATYYHDLGARMVLIYHDGPADHLRDLNDARTTIIACDDAFWERLGGRPPGLEERQAAVFASGMARCETEWVLLCDGDEFVFGDRPVEQFLEWIPETVDSVRLRTAEAVWGPGDEVDTPFGCTWFRVPWTNVRLWKLLRRVVYGKQCRFLRRGLVAHVSGKQFLRTGRRYTNIGNHYSERDGVQITVWAHDLGRGGAGMFLGHFDAIGFQRWRQKWAQRISRETQTSRMANTRAAQMDVIAAAMAKGDAATRRVFMDLYALNRWQARILSTLGYAFQRDIFRRARTEDGERRRP
ncbi:glycosyltransferase family 2 protein [Amaricoccus solimangrovi]|uniref:Glycosyl transferase family 2 n=1 Tax=Amaricoccus solimangrovi TaxID=2589815 RepID=A0A501WVT8_9RHOB|nr:glycosyltransferase family 2 protein [Amaricoccus solimangrovi]TPE52244.1 hypothetical protein FJM51_07460 [Amaricoccus solimangrovi]